jgi:methylated-DNA-[protein]-cysteine S-methyltransferase
MLHYRIFRTQWGFCGIVAGRRGLLATRLPMSSKAAVEQWVDRGFPNAEADGELMPELVAAVRAYFTGEPVRFTARLDLTSQTPFRRRVLLACRRIPYGQTASYADLARVAGSPSAFRAVGSAMANNPLPLVIPCHRVLRADGGIGGFSAPAGVSIKRRLLALEAAAS